MVSNAEIKTEMALLFVYDNDFFGIKKRGVGGFFQKNELPRGGGGGGAGGDISDLRVL